MIGKKLADRYQLLEKIGEGGMALVFRARDLRTGHDVAVKFLRPEFHDNPDFVAFFQREATAASKMSHHNIVNLLDVGDDASNLYIVIEYVNGKTLKDIVRERGRLPEDVASQIVIRILSALQHAHAANIIHRDIKPQNILVDQRGYIKVSDFGIARMVGSGTEIKDKKDTVMGSVHYFSPEQARGDVATTASDLYSVGVVFYELLTGKVPFDGEKPVTIALQHIQQKPRPVRELNPDVSPAIESVVMKALEKNPQDRYRSALDMAQAVKSALQFPEKENTRDTPVFEVPPQQGDKKQQKKRMRWQKLTTLAVALIVLGTLAFGSVAIYQRVVNTTEAPYLLGEKEEEALRIAIRARLKPEVVRQNSSAPAGTVILQSHDLGYKMRRGETILLTVSLGPVDQLVPKLVGQLQADADKAMVRIGLNMLVVRREMNPAAPGTVLSQQPAAGTKINTGEIVQVTISGGQLTVPDMVGKSREEAVRLLQNAGLPMSKLSVEEVPVQDNTQFGRVADQFPEKGEVVMPLDENLEVVLAVYVQNTEPTP